ncbi:hypothetical protein HRbin04_00684 [archaeon HR04]|nr:hypothetical protein HRbin04_00684 [archaeon HR04]
MIIYQILGNNDYSEVEYEIDDGRKAVYRCRLSSEALYKHCNAKKIVLLKPESISSSIDKTAKTVEHVKANTDGNTEIKPIQAVGIYNNIHYNGTPSNVSLQIFADMLRRNREGDMIIVDLSTGYNLYVLSLLEAARFYTSYMRLSYANISKIFVRYAVSEPVVKDSGPCPYKIYIEELETRTTFDLPLHTSSETNLTSFIEDVSDVDKKDIGQKFSSLNGRVKRILNDLTIIYNAIRYNAPLFLFTARIDFGKEGENNDIVNDLCKFIDHILNEKKKKIKRALYSIFLSIAIRNGVWYMLRDKLNENNDVGIPLDTLKSVSKLIYDKLELDLNWRFLEREIREIESYKEHLSSEWRAYKEVKSISSRPNIDDQQQDALITQNIKLRSDSKRNFFAHAGLSYDTVELRLDNERILCRYKLDKINEIQKWIKDPD